MKAPILYSPMMGLGASLDVFAETPAVVIEDFMFESTTAYEITPLASGTVTDYHDTWDLDGTDFTPEASPDDEGYWDDFENIVLNGNYEELGGNIVTNGTFDADANWTTSFDSWSISGGKANSDGSQSGNAELVQQNGVGGVTLNIVNGKTYELTLDVVVQVGAITQVEVGGTYATDDITSSGTYTRIITASSTNKRLTITANPTFEGAVDNVTLKQVDPNDRWTLGTGWSISDGKARYDASSGSSFTFLGQASLFPGAGDYQVTFTLGDLGGSFAYNHAGIVVNGIVNSFNGFGISSAKTHTVSINLDGSNLNLNFYGHTSGGDFSIDDVQVKEYAITPLDV